MDGQRFDPIVKDLHTRRSAIGRAGGMGGDGSSKPWEVAQW
jgi:hypothetical protein